MLLAEWILAALFAVAAVVFAVGAALVWGLGVGLMVGAVLLAVWSWSIVDHDAPAAGASVDTEHEAAAKRSTAGPFTPSDMMASLADDDSDDSLE